MSVAMDKRSSRSYGGYVDVFENTQSRTFLKWWVADRGLMMATTTTMQYSASRSHLILMPFGLRLNARLESANIPTMTNLATDLSDGVRLCQLMVC